jgi:hypothetical protein
MAHRVDARRDTAGGSRPHRRGRRCFAAAAILFALISAPFAAAEEHRPTTAFSLNYDDAGGEAGAARAADLRLTYRYLGDPLVLLIYPLIPQAGYDRNDPASGKPGNDNVYGVSASVSYTSPWDWSPFGTEPIRFYATGAYFHTGSGSDSHRPDSALGAAGISLEW